MTALPVDPIFISYSRRDSEIMRKIVVFLRDHGFNVWVDNEKLIPGTPIWEEEIEKAIKAASAVIVVMSPDSKNSEWVRREISLADQYHKQILPILVRGDEDSSITLRLVTRQFVDMRKEEETGLESLFSALSWFFPENEVRPEEKTITGQVEPGFHEASHQRIEIVHQPTHQIETTKTPASTDWTMIFWFALGWMIAGGIGGLAYNSLSIDIFGDISNELMAGMIGGLIGGLVMIATVRSFRPAAYHRNLLPLLGGWTLGGGIGWLIGFELTEAVGAGIGMVIFVIIGLISTFGFEFIFTNWKSAIGISTAWLIGEVIGWLIARRWLIDTLDAEKGISWAIGTAMAWGIGGFVLGLQLQKTQSDKQSNIRHS